MTSRNAQRTDERSLADLRSLTEAFARAAYDSGLSIAQIAERLGVSRGYLADALNTERADVLQFQARLFIPFVQAVGPLPLAYVADQCGYVLVKREHATDADSLSDEIHQLQKRAGELTGRYLDAKRDGRLCLMDRADLKEFARRVMREAAEIERAVESLPFQVEVRR